MRGRREESVARELRKLLGTPREFSYGVLKKATRNFYVSDELGRGFGVVYRGIIPGENIVVAVKKFPSDTLQRDFLAQLPIIIRFRHKNLVRILGWCFMPNGSLDQHLYSELPAPPLEWRRRVQILAGVASALLYLRNQNDLKVVHRDIKTSNILLDAEFNARLGDFALARAIENERTSKFEVQGWPGTQWHLAPECFLKGMATPESDVFAFGLVVLEVVSGRNLRDYREGFESLTDWVWNFYTEGNILLAVDKILGEDFHGEEARKLLVLGLACGHPKYEDRPKTIDVFQVICGSAPPPEIPLALPPFIWASDLSEGYDNSPDFTQCISAGTTSRLQGKEFLSVPERGESVWRFY